MAGEQKERWLWGPRMSQQLSAFLVIQWQQRSKGKGQGVELEKNKVSEIYIHFKDQLNAACRNVTLQEGKHKRFISN